MDTNTNTDLKEQLRQAYMSGIEAANDDRAYFEDWYDNAFPPPHIAARRKMTKSLHDFILWYNKAPESLDVPYASCHFTFDSREALIEMVGKCGRRGSDDPAEPELKDYVHDEQVCTRYSFPIGGVNVTFYYSRPIGPGGGIPTDDHPLIGVAKQAVALAPVLSNPLDTSGCDCFQDDGGEF